MVKLTSAARRIAELADAAMPPERYDDDRFGTGKLLFVRQLGSEILGGPCAASGGRLAARRTVAKDLSWYFETGVWPKRPLTKVLASRGFHWRKPSQQQLFFMAVAAAVLLLFLSVGMIYWEPDRNAPRRGLQHAERCPAGAGEKLRPSAPSKMRPCIRCRILHTLPLFRPRRQRKRKHPPRQYRPLPSPRKTTAGLGDRVPRNELWRIPRRSRQSPRQRWKPSRSSPTSRGLGPTGLPLIDGNFAPPSESRLMKPNVIARLDPLQIRINGQPLAETSYKDRVVVRGGSRATGTIRRFHSNDSPPTNIGEGSSRQIEDVRIQAFFAVRSPSLLDEDARSFAETDWLELPVKNDCQYDIYFDLGPKGVQLLQKEAKVDAE